jgi:hypothetical protein
MDVGVGVDCDRSTVLIQNAELFSQKVTIR